MNTNMKTCSACGASIAKSAKACPQCGAKNLKPIYLRPWFLILLAIALIVSISSIQNASKNFTLEITDGPAAGTIKAADLVELGSNDKNRYDEMYYGSSVTFTAKITGTQGRTTNANLGKTYASALEFDLPGTGEIIVYLSSTTQFSTGDTVTVRGILTTHLYSTVYISAYESSIHAA